MKHKKITRADWEGLSVPAVLHADPEEDRIYLNFFVHMLKHGRAVDKALELLGGEMDEWFMEDPEYWTACGKVRSEEDFGWLRDRALAEDSLEARFAFSRLTAYQFPVSEGSAYMHRTYYCGRLPGMTPEKVSAFCSEMIREKGPFAAEAEECLKNPPLTFAEMNEKFRAEGKRIVVDGPFGWD